jgi:hypothetical protein
LGSLEAVSLKQAREKAAGDRLDFAEGRDPVLEAKAEAERHRQAMARTTNFQIAAQSYIKAHEASWRNEKHRAQWGSTLSRYVYPVFGDRPVSTLTTADVLRVLTPIW